MQRTPLDFDEIFGCLVRIVKELVSQKDPFQFFRSGCVEYTGYF